MTCHAPPSSDRSAVPIEAAAGSRTGTIAPLVGVCTTQVVLGWQHAAGNQAVTAILQRQSRRAPDPARESDPDRLTETLMRAVMAAETALRDPALDPAARRDLSAGLPAAHAAVDRLLAMLRQERTRPPPAASPDAAGAAISVGGLAQMAGRGGSVGASGVGSAVLGRAIVAAAMLMAAIELLRGIGIMSGASYAPYADAVPAAQVALDRVRQTLMAAGTRPLSWAPPNAVPRLRTGVCTPGRQPFDVSSEQGWARDFFTREAPQTYLNRGVSAGRVASACAFGTNMAAAAVVDSNGCTHRVTRGTFYQGASVGAHAEVVALAQLRAVLTPMRPQVVGNRLVIVVGSTPCGTCRPVIRQFVQDFQLRSPPLVVDPGFNKISLGLSAEFQAMVHAMAGASAAVGSVGAASASRRPH